MSDALSVKDIFDIERKLIAKYFNMRKKIHPDESGWRNRATYHIRRKNNSHTRMRQ